MNVPASIGSMDSMMNVCIICFMDLLVPVVFSFKLLSDLHMTVDILEYRVKC